MGENDKFETSTDCMVPGTSPTAGHFTICPRNILGEETEFYEIIFAAQPYDIGRLGIQPPAGFGFRLAQGNKAGEA